MPVKPKVRHWTQILGNNFFSTGISKVVYPLLWRLPAGKSPFVYYYLSCGVSGEITSNVSVVHK